HQPYRGARQGHLATARHSSPHRPRAARKSQRVQKPRLQDRSCGSRGRGPAENRDFRAAMGCPPHARAAYASIANAPTASRNISPPWAGARAEMIPCPPSGALPSLKIAQDLAKAHGWAITMPRSWTHRRRKYRRARQPRANGRDDLAKLDPAEIAGVPTTGTAHAIPTSQPRQG